MSTPKYTIGQAIRETQAVGDCIVKDIFLSPTTENFCYLVSTETGDFFLPEDELDSTFTEPETPQT